MASHRVSWLVLGVLAGWVAGAPAGSGRPATAADSAKAARSVAATGGVDDPKGAGMVSSGVALPAIPPVTGSRQAPAPSWGKPLPYPIVIADRRNNRLLEVTPDKRIVWEFPSPNLTVYSGNEDVNFGEDGRTLAVSEEDNYPDDAHLLPDGKVMTADIRNCRILFIDRATLAIAAQWGVPGRCRHDPPRTLGHPNGATPLSNGDILVTEIQDAWISRITRAGRVLWSVRAPKVKYPSDAFPTRDGQVIVADFAKPGRVVIFDPKTRRVTWEYHVPEGEGMLDHPSLARELPDTGDIIVADDLRHRVVVIDRQTKAFIWQYGVTDQTGHAPGYLFYPDGFDLDVFRDWKGTAPAR